MEMFSEVRVEGDFTLSSGRKSSVFYDLDLLTPLETAAYAEQLFRSIPKDLLRSAQFIASPALGGIAVGFLVAFAAKKPFVILDKEGRLRGPEIRTGNYLIVDDVTTSYLAVKQVIAALPEASCLGTACFIFRGDPSQKLVPTFCLMHGEREEGVSERWAPVVGFEGKYSVSSLGNVRSEDRIITQENGIEKSLKGKELSILYDGQGYPQVGLGKEKKALIHSLVLEAFVRPRPEGLYARHLNGNKQDNRLENLMWDTLVNNQHDKLKHGTNNSGERNGQAKLTEDQVQEIRKLREDGWRYSALADKFSLKASSIKDICSRKNWKYLE